MTPPGHGYERRISIPDGMAVSAPFDKKRLDGGLYAAHMILFGAVGRGLAVFAPLGVGEQPFRFQMGNG